MSTTPLPLLPKQNLKRRGPVLNVVLDGIAINPHTKAPFSQAPQNRVDALAAAHTPTLNFLRQKFLYRELFAHGTHVGMPTERDMGNSEVGHNAFGAGQVYPQGAKLVEQALQSGACFQGIVWRKTIDQLKKNNATLHLLGLLSDGNVHSHIKHLKILVSKAAAEGIKKIALHALLDGRDVPPASALVYVQEIEAHFLAVQRQTGVLPYLASVGGRMVIVMDRYEANWGMIEKAWQHLVEGGIEGQKKVFSSAGEGITRLRSENLFDQFFPPFLIASRGKPITQVQDGDTVLLFNFRGDRAIEISQAFEGRPIPITKKKTPKVNFVGLMQYDADTKTPRRYLVSPPRIKNPMGQLLTQSGQRLFALSETQKYGHVTYFWNGNRSGSFDPKLETYVEISGDEVPFEQRPWMKSAEITDKAIALLSETPPYAFGRINYPNGDMVGHSGDFRAARLAVEAVDLAIARLLKAVAAAGGIALITADHGNCDEMVQTDSATGVIKKNPQGEVAIKTSHSLNKVPLFIYDPDYKGEYYWNPNLPQAGIAQLAATTLSLMNFTPPPEYLPSLLLFSSP